MDSTTANEETLYYSNFSILNNQEDPKMGKFFRLKKRLVLLLGNFMSLTDAETDKQDDLIEIGWADN